MSLVLAYYIRFRIISRNVTEPTSGNYIAMAVIFTILNIYFFWLSRLYRPHRGVSKIDIVFQLIKSSVFSFIILLAISFFYRDFSYSRLTIIYGVLISIIVIPTGRIIIISIEKSLLSVGHGLKRVVIIGTGNHFNNVVSRFLGRPELGYELVGYIEEEQKNDLEKIALLGSLSEMEHIFVIYNVDVVIVTLKPEDNHWMKEIIDLCDRRTIECFLAPDMLELMVGPRFYEEVCGVPLIRVKGLRINGLNAILKRTMDILISIIALVTLFPMFLIVSLMIAITSKGPIFYMQKRVGMDGNIFWMYKFRTMISNIESVNGPGWSREEDDRVTKIGGILRKLSIDELPQLINVLKGEMSLIGPRPERPFYVEKFEKGIPRYMERHKVKSGMSGWAQVNGLRGDTSIPERLQYDLYYIENWNIWFDFKIIILTIVDIYMAFVRNVC